MDDKLLHEIEEVLSKVEQTQRKSHSKRHSFSLNNGFMHLGMFFFLIFLFSITQNSLIFQVFSILSFMILSITLLKTVADMIHYKKLDLFYGLIAFALLCVVCISYYSLWVLVLVKHSLLLSILLGILIVFSSGFYLLHGYMSYLQNIATNESVIVALMVFAAWFLLLVNVLYSNVLTQLLLIISTLVLMKAVYDFSQQFVKRDV